jgi:hypothetical protein
LVIFIDEIVSRGWNIMKKIASTLLPFLILTGCISFPVTVEKDPFRGVSVVTADMWHTVIEGNVDNVRVLYQKEIKIGENLDPVVSFVFIADMDPYYGGYYGEGLKPEAYILADGKSFKVILSERNNVKRVSHPYVYAYPMWFPYYRSVIIRTVQQHVLTAKLTLTPDIQGAILPSKSCLIRFFVGDNPVTLEATPKQLASVKKFLATSVMPNP